jgi:hypothetical protein
MILHPAIIALLISSGLMSLLVFSATWYGIRIIRNWDIRSGSSIQLDLERRTYFISTVLTYAFGFQLISLFLFVYTADSLCTLFTGAMCAVGTLNVNEYGYPVLILKLLNFILAGLWLIVNYTDNRGYDYPLIRKKYAFLIGMAPLLMAETVLQASYFLNLHPDVITSCCGSLFSSGGQNIASGISTFPPKIMEALLSFAMAMTLGAGILFFRKQRGGYVLSVVAAASFPIALASVLAFIAPYVYELPTHHCPFCLLQKEYGYIGYPLYAALLGGSVSGMGVGVLMPFKATASLSSVIPALQKNLAMLSILSYSVFTVIVLFKIFVSHLVL